MSRTTYRPGPEAARSNPDTQGAESRSDMFFSQWDSTKIPHLAVVGRVGDGRAAVVDSIIEYFISRHATTVMIYPALNPQLTPVTTLVKGAQEAETVLQQYLGELHRRFTAIERRSTIPLTPIVIIVDSLESLLATTSNQQQIHRLQLDLEAIAILGKNVGLHLVFSGDELPYLAEQARRDLGIIAIAGEHDSLDTLPIGSGWFFAPGSVEPRSVQLDAGSAGSPS